MKPIYDTLGGSYGQTRRADPEIVRTLAAALSLSDSGAYLDLACGTGNYTCALSEKGGSWSGVDISETMLRQAVAKSDRIVWSLGEAAALPFASASFDGVMCTLAIHHFPSLEAPFREVARVLRSGHFVLFTSHPEQMRGYWLNRYFPEMMARSTDQMPTRSSLLAALESAGLEVVEERPYFVSEKLKDLFLYSGKHRPELYFDPGFRANISSFAALCSPGELEKGLAALESDLRSGMLERSSFAGGDGDYVFVVSRQRRT